MAQLTPDVERDAPKAAQHAVDRAPDWVADGTPEPLCSQLIAVLGPDKVLSRALDLVGYASDASPYRQIPKAVVIAHDTSDVVALMALARRSGFSLVFRGAGRR